jgi:hypothetical protein
MIWATLGLIWKVWKYFVWPSIKFFLYAWWLAFLWVAEELVLLSFLLGLLLLTVLLIMVVL